MCFAYDILVSEFKDLPKVYIPNGVITFQPTADIELRTIGPKFTPRSAPKRSGSISQIQPPSKKAKLSDENEDEDGFETIDLVDRSSPEVETPKVNKKSLIRKSAKGQEEVPMSLTEELAEVREKSNRLLRERKEEIATVRAELNKVQADRDSWHLRALDNKAELEAFQQNNKKIEETKRKKMQDGLKADYEKKLKKAEAEHAEKLASAKDKYEEQLLAKESALAKKSKAKATKLQENIDLKQEKIEELENTIAETKHNAKEAEQKLKSQHRDELRKYKPEFSEAIHNYKALQKALLKAKDTELEKLKIAKESLQKERDGYQKQWTLVSGRNDQLQSMIRTNTRKILELQISVTELKHNSEESEKVQEQMKKTFEAEMKAKQAMWLKRYDIHFREKQDTNIGLANSRRGVFLLNQANDRNILLVEQLREKVAGLEKKLATAEAEIDTLRTSRTDSFPGFADSAANAYRANGGNADSMIAENQDKPMEVDDIGMQQEAGMVESMN